MVLVTRFTQRLCQGAAVLRQNWRRQISVTHFLNKDRLYTDKHEWVIVDGNVGTVGISDYAQEALGDVVFAQLPEPGITLKQHDECGALESVKAASEIYSPVSGQVNEKNGAVEDLPALVNTNCYDKGWLFKVTLSDPKELNNLMSEDQYKTFLKNSEH